MDKTFLGLLGIVFSIIPSHGVIVKRKVRWDGEMKKTKE
jgi:hypothetical protein